MNVRLVVEQGARRRVVHIDEAQAGVGRAHGNTVRIPSAEVSRQHCRLLLQDGLVTVEDLGSVNGTFLNGRRLRDPEYVRPGDHLEVGPVRFVVEYELTPDALERLRGEDAAGVLELLADGDGLEVEAADGELVIIGTGDEDLPAPLAVDEFNDVEIHAENMPADDGPLAADFDFDAKDWEMPEGGDLRDLLSQMEDDDSPTQYPREG
jgi:hypothetical protein